MQLLGFKNFTELDLKLTRAWSHVHALVCISVYVPKRFLAPNLMNVYTVEIEGVHNCSQFSQFFTAGLLGSNSG